MMNKGKVRLQISEYGRGINLSSEITSRTGISRIQADRILKEAGQRVASNLKLDYSPFDIDGSSVRIKDIAGIIQLSANIELEVIPKFLDASNSGKWREDFFFLATLTKYGRLLNYDKISSSRGDSKNISTLIARSYSNMYQENRRRPLRKYQRINVTDFSLDGDIDPIELINPSEDGYQQEVFKFTKINNWNSILQAATYKLLGEISDPKIANNLTRIIEDFSSQAKPDLNRLQKIPSRQKIWKPVFDLAIDILKDLNLDFDPGVIKSPGFLINTWRTWEDLLSLSIKLGFNGYSLNFQKGYKLGIRQRRALNDLEVRVFPDCVVHSNRAMPSIIIDAKYKGNADYGPLRISESDIYESLAFADATGYNFVILAYPAPFDNQMTPTGSCIVFENVIVNNVTIYGIQINVNGISQKSGLKTFSINLASQINNILI